MVTARDVLKARVRTLLRWGLAAGLVALLAVAISHAPTVERAMLSVVSGAASLQFVRAACAAAGVLLVLAFLVRRPLLALAERIGLDYEQVLAARPTSWVPCGETTWSRALLLLMGLVGVGLSGLAFLEPAAYERLVQEDGPVEYATAVLFGAGGVLAGLGALRARHRLGRVAYALGAIFLVVCMGEEISWGQRLFGFEAPDALREVNKQDEVNLHNIGSISVFANAFFLLTLLVFLWLPRTLKRTAELPAYLAHYDLPRVHPGVPRIFLVGVLLWILVGLRFGTLGFHPFSLWGHYTQLDDEIFEFVAAYSFFALMVLDRACRGGERPERPPSA